ncbi:MAG: hypothetical protein IJH63_03205 [Methanobrevibacter sp.]|nr:hypothetical protein [Methanobrevibacter sp.]
MGNKPYSNLKCPECGVKGEFEIDNSEEVYCIHCGLVIQSPFPYSAGIRYNTLIDILIQKRIERFNKKRWRREYARIKKFQKI